MGPPPFGDGNPLAVLVDSDAVRILQWGHRLSAMETGVARRRETRRDAEAFNGATAFRRWKLVLEMAVFPVGCRAFNGATAFRRWKPAGAVLQVTIL